MMDLLYPLLLLADHYCKHGGAFGGASVAINSLKYHACSQTTDMCD